MIQLESPTSSRLVLFAVAGILTLTTLTAAATQSDARAASRELAPALGPEGAAVAFTAEDSRGRPRVHVATPVSAAAIAVGPRLSGLDGAPKLTRTPDGQLLVMASRRSRRGSSLWSRRHDGHRWQPARVLPTEARESHHPALASGGGETWAVWVSGHGDRSRETLRAARWLGDSWSAPEIVPGAPGEPMAPALAVDDAGLPAVVWAASDGDHGQIWVVRRGERGWRSPRQITDEPVPEIMPDAAFDGRDLIVAWARLAAGEYRVWAARLDRHGGRSLQRISSRAGHAPRVLVSFGGPKIVWSGLAVSDPETTVVRTARLEESGWSRPEPVGQALNARVATAGKERWRIAWHGTSGVTVVELSEFDNRLRARPLRGDLEGSLRGARAPLDLQLPGTWLAFGDSITAGLVRFDGVISFVEGYPTHLGRMLSELLGTSVIVEERAIPGEMTTEGLPRLQRIMATAPRQTVLLNEGANDLANLVDEQIVVDTLLSMVGTVRSHDSFPVLSTILPRRELDFGGGTNLRIDETNDLLRASSRRIGILVDFDPAFDGNGGAYSDHIHPDAEGYELMAEVWLGGLLPVLNALLEEQDISAALDAQALLEEEQARRSRRQ